MKITGLERFLRYKFNDNTLRLIKTLLYGYVNRTISTIEDSSFLIRIDHSHHTRFSGGIFILDNWDNTWKYSGVSIIDYKKYRTKKRVYIKYVKEQYVC